MNKFKHSGWLLKIDEDVTNNFYTNYNNKVESNVGENFYDIIDDYSVKLNDFLENLNIDIKKPIEIYNFGIDKKNRTIDYAAYYIVFGTCEAKGEDIIIEEAVIKIDDKKTVNIEESTLQSYFIVEVYNLILKIDEANDINEIFPAIDKKSIILERLKQAFNK